MIERERELAKPPAPGPFRAPAPSVGQHAMLRLQRAVGNRAVTQLIGAAAPVVQRVGGTKIGFEYEPEPPVSPDLHREGVTLLKQAWEGVRRAAHDAKVGPIKTNVEDAAKTVLAEKDRDKWPKHLKGGGFTGYYAGQLTGSKRAQQEKALITSPAFTSGRLKLDGDMISYRTAARVKTPPTPATYIPIATLKRGDDAFEPGAGPGGLMQQQLYLKKGVNTSFNTPGVAKEYVKDSRGVLTRRYAFVEKNYFQMMEFFMTHHMEGRFASFMKAAGNPAPNLYEHRDPGVDMVVPGATQTAPLTVEQMAVAHQKLGSSPEQRGVSLTATPKVNATYVNTGQNFRTDQGFRLKVDLALVPPDTRLGPKFVNHYSAGGVVDSPDGYDTRRERTKPGNYPYKDSSIHARELYLEFLKPEWIITIEYHDAQNTTGAGRGSQTVDASTPRMGGASLLETAKATFGGGDYETGFAQGLRAADDTLPPTIVADSHEAKGFSGARLFVKGWTAGEQEHRARSSRDAAKRSAKNITADQHVYDRAMKHQSPDNKYDLYRYGFLRGRAGKGLITTPAELKNLSA